MPLVKRFFRGGMDLDTSVYRVGADSYLEAYDVTRDARRGDGDVHLTGLRGNRMADFPLPSGRNKVIGAKEDRRRNCVYFFVWNEQYFHSILKFDVATRSVTKVLQSRTDSANDADFLNFTEKGTIHSVDILHREEGDLMFFVDSLRRPRQINIAKAESGWYAGKATRQNTSAIKAPPLDEPDVAYADDNTAIVNNLKKDLFQFSYQFEYDDFSQSTWSAYSKMPIPVNYLNQNVVSDPTKNAIINVTVQTGGPDVTKIRIAARSSNVQTYTDLYEVAVLDKALLGLSDYSTYVFQFRNDGSYSYIPKDESILLHTYLPDEANTQALINGSVLAYAGITEGRDRDCTPDVQTQKSTQSVPFSKDTVVPMYNWFAKYRFGIAYYDENGKTPGVISPESMVVSMPNYSDNGGNNLNIPVVQFSIGHQPPIWAKRMRFVRTKNLTQSETLYWITSGTEADDKFAYLDITNLGDYVKNNPGSEMVLKYDFAPGDRVRFVKRYVDVPGIPSIFDKEDYVIEGLVTDPLINGADRVGKFLKIKLPGSASNLQFGSFAFMNYLIMIYRPTPTIATTGDVFFEFGESYDILDPGTTSRRHAGQNGQDQGNPNIGSLAPRAIYTFTEGDFYLHYGAIDTSRRIQWDTVQSATDWEIHTIPVNFKGINSPANGYTARSITIGPRDLGNANRSFLTTSRAIVGRMKGRIDVTFDGPYPYKLYLVVTSLTSGMQTEIVLIAGSDSNRYEPGRNQFEFDVPVSIPFNHRVHFLGQTKIVDSGRGRDVSYNVTEVEIVEQQTVDTRFPSESFSYNFLAKVSSNGRPLTSDEDSARIYNPTMLRFGGEYPQGEKINKTTLFFPENVEEYDRSYGDIMRLRVRDRTLRVFQKFKVGGVPIFQQVIKDSAGNDMLAQSDKLLNNMQYYVGEFGIGDCPDSLASNNYADYFIDNNRGVICRLSLDGITVLSILYKANSWATQELPLRGIDSKCYGVYDAESNRYILSLEQAGDSPAMTIIFDEPGNQFESFSRMDPEYTVCIHTLLCSFKGGKIWTHDSDTFCNYFGVQYKPSVKLIFNDGPDFRKSFISLGYVANKKWIATRIDTSLGQVSVLDQAGDWKKLEDGYSASFLRDQNSPKGLMRGDTLKGNWVSVNLEAETGDTLSSLVSAAVSYIESNKNIR